MVKRTESVRKSIYVPSIVKVAQWSPNDTTIGSEI